MKKILLISFTLICLSSVFLTASKTYNISESQVNAIENKYGSSAKVRIEQWDSMIQTSRNEPLLNQIKNVNDFFNELTYKTDLMHWKKKIIGLHLLNS